MLSFNIAILASASDCFLRSISITFAGALFTNFSFPSFFNTLCKKPSLYANSDSSFSTLHRYRYFRQAGLRIPPCRQGTKPRWHPSCRTQICRTNSPFFSQRKHMEPTPCLRQPAKAKSPYSANFSATAPYALRQLSL